MGFFKKIAEGIKKTKDNISSKLSALFAKGLGDDFYDELEEILISADISVVTAEEIVEQIRDEARREKLKDKEYVVNLLKDVIEDTLNEAEVPVIEYPAVIMLVGVNGVGKTTTIGKLANYFVREKKSGRGGYLPRRRVRPALGLGGQGQGPHRQARGGQ